MTRGPHFESQRKPAVTRRRFLRGAGVSIALPAFASLLSSRVYAEETRAASAFATTSTGAPLRMAFMSIPNGVQQDHWFPGDGFVLNETMKSLESLNSQFQVISGLDHQHATAGRDGAGDHARASATYLTGARARKTAGSDIHVGVSIDQVAAQAYGGVTRFPSLELSSDVVRNSGSCDSGYACAYQYNLSWSSATTPVSPEPNPRLVFERLFGAGEKNERQQNHAKRMATEKSVLDFVLEESADVAKSLGSQDRRKFDEYLSVVREMEQRIKAAEKFNALPETDAAVPSGIPGDFSQHMKLMYDLLALAFQTDSTRVATLLLAYDGSNRTYSSIGIPEGHHYLTHNQRDPLLVKKLVEIDKYYMECFAYFLEKLSRTQDVDGNSLLHNSMIVYGGAIADGNRHSHDNLPLILAGSGGGTLHPGRFLKASSQPMANMFVAMLNRMGVETKEFGDSTGCFDEI